MAEAEIARHIVRFAKRCSAVCDVGASDGWYCLLAHKHNPKIKIVAMEPDSHLAARAQSNFAHNGIIGTGQTTWIANFCGTKNVSLDEALADISGPILIKIDIEGAELDALQSGIKTLTQEVCYLVVETHSSALETQCKNFLENVGYNVRIIRKGWYRVLCPERRPLRHNQWLLAVRADSFRQISNPL